MAKYRIFTNDRGKKRGVPMYSALKEVSAASPQAAQARVSPMLGPPEHAAIVAIEWPPRSQEAKDWLERHV